MIEIFAMVVITVAFVLQAESNQQNRVYWGIIGAGSFAVPVLIFSLFAYPELLSMSNFSWLQDWSGTWGLSLLNVAIGLLCCLSSFLKLATTRTVLIKENVLSKEHFR